MRTKQEIEQKIEALKNTKNNVPKFSLFGDDNHSKIDAQIGILSGTRKANDYYLDETAEEYEDGDNDTYWSAVSAQNWMNGGQDELECD